MGVQEVSMTILGVIKDFFLILFWYLEAIFRQFVPPPMKSIDGDTILVTGAAGGIGKELCRYLVKCGTDIKLVMWDLHQTDLEKLAEELKTIGAPGLKVFPFPVDISSRENIEAGCKQVKDAVGPVSIIFNNAGIAPSGNCLQLSNEAIQKTIDVNLMSHFWIIRQFLPEMLVMNHGRIVNVCSMGGLKAATHAFPYFASKFAVNGYTESMKAELTVHQYNYDGIHFSTVYPYFVQTPLIGSLAVNPQSGSSMPSTFQRFLTPEEVAKKSVDGMRREYEYIYCPPIIPLILLSDYFLPVKVRKFIETKHFSNFIFKDAAEQNRLFNTPYLAPSSNGKSKKGE